MKGEERQIGEKNYIVYSFVVLWLISNVLVNVRAKVCLNIVNKILGNIGMRPKSGNSCVLFHTAFSTLNIL